MPKRMIPIIVTAGLIYAVASVPKLSFQLNVQPPMSKASYSQVTKDVSAQYQVDKDACSSFKGNSYDVCVAEAKGKRRVARAEAESAYRQTPKAREYARIAHAKATYSVAIEKCESFAGAAKDACVNNTKTQYGKL
jgi:hypothetical protein